MGTIHPLLLAKKIPFTYSKPQVVRLMSGIPQTHFPKCRSSQQRKTQTSLHVCFTCHSRLTTTAKLRRTRNTIASYCSQTST